MVSPTLSKTLVFSAMVLVPATAAVHAVLSRSGEEGARYVSAARLPLRPAPSLESAPVRAEILHGATVQVMEEREGWSRVNLWGWVPSDQLVAERPDLTNTEPGPTGPLAGSDPRRNPDAVADVDQNGQRVTDLRKTTRLSVSTVTDFTGKNAPQIVVGVGFLAHNVLVSFEEPPIDVELALYENRLMAGTRTHGKRLYPIPELGGTGKATLARWEDGLTGSRKITIPLSQVDLNTARTDTAILVVRAALPNGYVVYGRDYDVSLREEEKPANAAPKSSAPPAEEKKPDERKDG
jgi:hypothetical protein